MVWVGSPSFLRNIGLGSLEWGIGLYQTILDHDHIVLVLSRWQQVEIN